jgi:hypothetical protein
MYSTLERLSTDEDKREKRVLNNKLRKKRENSLTNIIDWKCFCLTGDC